MSEGEAGTRLLDSSLVIWIIWGQSLDNSVQCLREGRLGLPTKFSPHCLFGVVESRRKRKD